MRNPEIMESEKATNDPWVPLDTDNPLDGPATTLSNGQDQLSPFDSFDGSAFVMPAPVDPLRQTIDSERYIQSLERKLDRLKKAKTLKSKEPTSRDIITSLALFHDDQMRRYIDTSAPVADNQVFNSFEDSNPALSALQRRLHPERQPLNAEEVIELVKEDIVAKTFEELSASASDMKISIASTSKDSKHTSDSVKNSGKDDTGVVEKLEASEHSCDKVPSGHEDPSIPSQTRRDDGGTEGNDWANFDEMNTKDESGGCE